MPTTVEQLRAKGRIRLAAGLLGPAFVASVAYVDPGNFATNFAGGAEDGYQLVWVIVLANSTAMLVQYLTAKAGLATGRSLPELCRDRYGPRANKLLWLQAEVVAMATDLAEFVGAAVGMNLVFGIPLLAGGLITGAVAFGVLGLHQRDYRQYELTIITLLGVTGLSFVYLYFKLGGEDYGQIAAGLVPRLGGTGATGLTVGIIGATVMPHVVYLHSALHQDRVRANGPADRRLLLAASKWDCIVGLGAAGLFNLIMLCIAAARIRPAGQDATNLSFIHDRLAAVAGGGAALAFGIGLIASGLSSSSVGTHAGQVVMAGFTNRGIPLRVRRALTALPSLIILALPVSTGQALIYSQVVLSFGIPFALVPLLLVTRDPATMGDLANRRVTTGAMLLAVMAITAMNAILIGQVIAAAV